MYRNFRIEFKNDYNEKFKEYCIQARIKSKDIENWTKAFN